MIRCRSHHQIPLAKFDWPFQVALDEHNRWVKMSESIPWDEDATVAPPQAIRYPTDVNLLNEARVFSEKIDH